MSLLQAFGYPAIIQLVNRDKKYLCVGAVFEPVLVAFPSSIGRIILPQ